MIETRVGARSRPIRPARGRLAPGAARGWSGRIASDLFSAVGTLLGFARIPGRLDRRPAADRIRAAQDEFLGRVSHELRTPVTTIYGNAQLLMAHPTAGAETERLMIRDIADDSERLLAILDNLLLLARLDAGMAPYREPLLLTHHLRAACAAASERRGRQVAFAFRGGDDVVVDADHACLELLMRNLLANSFAYSPRVEPVEVVLDATSSEAHVSVLDRGIGVGADSPDVLARPFFRGVDAQRLASGMGLGLTVCARILAAHGGRLWAHDRAGGGAEIGFALPLMADPGS